MTGQQVTGQQVTGPRAIRPSAGPVATRVVAGTTWRGRTFLAVGLVLFVGGLAAGEQQVLRLGVLALAVPVAGAVVLAGSRGGLSVTRSLDRAQIAPGETAVVTLTVTNGGRVPVSGALLLQPLTDQVVRAGATSTSGAGGARRRVGPLRAGERTTAELALTAAVRGHHELPAAIVTLSDPFGMIRRTWSADAGATVDRPTVLTVTPATTRLDGRPGDGPAGVAALGRGRSVGVAGEQDSSVREYSPGDDVRRIHWRSTAHRGELMVRQEEQPWQARLTVVLDTRGAGFSGDGPDCGFEWAVSAAASVVEHAARLGYEVELVTDPGPLVPGGWVRASRDGGQPDGGRRDGGQRDGGRRSGERPGRSRPPGGRGTSADRRRVARAALDRLVDLRARPATRAGGPGSVRERICRTSMGSGSGGGVDTVVAVLGAIGVGDLSELSELRTGRTTAIALLVDRGTDPGPDPAPGGGREGPDGQLGSTTVVRTALAAQGWQTGVVTGADGIRQAWDTARSTGRSTGPSTGRSTGHGTGGVRAPGPTRADRPVGRGGR